MYRAADYRDVVEEVTEELDEQTECGSRGRDFPRARDRRPRNWLCQACRAQPDDARRASALWRGSARPVLVGPSRKSYLKTVVGDRPADEREWATAAAVTASVLLGAHIVRVHGVPEMVDVVRTADAIRQAARL